MSHSSNIGAAKASSSSADFEVQKLKDLVKKLERQNQHLRYKTGKLSPHSRNDIDSYQAMPNEHSNHSEPNANVMLNDVVEDETILESELKQLDTADDTSWLYVSPKAKHTETRSVLEQWVREDLDHPPTPQIAQSKKNFLRKLESPYSYDFFKSENPSYEGGSPYLPVSKKSPPQEPLLQNYSDMSTSPTTPKSNRSSFPIERQLFSQNDEENYSHHSRHRNDVFHSPKTRTSHSEEKVHHMPLPSHTMTSAHGLVSSSSVMKSRQRSPSPLSRSTRPSSDTNMAQRASGRHYSPISRGESPTRRSRMKNSLSDRTSLTPRKQSPSTPLRNSSHRVSDPQRGRSSSPRQVSDILNNDKATGGSGLSRLRMPSGLPRSQSPMYGVNSSTEYNRQKPNNARQLKPPSRAVKLTRGSNSEPSSESLSVSQSTNSISATRSLTPRRALPRPSQSGRNSNSKSLPEYVKKSHTTPNISTEHTQDTYASPCGSESGSSDVWKDGEFY